MLEQILTTTKMLIFHKKSCKTKLLYSEMNKVLLLLQAFSSLADAAFENAQPTSEDDEEPTTYALSKKFEFIVQKIIQTGDRLV